MATVSWLDGSGNWTTSGDWSTGSPPAPGDDAILGGTTIYTVSLTTAVTVNSIAVTDAQATLVIGDPGGVETISAGFTNSGTLRVDQSDAGGTTVNIGGTLTNANFIGIGNNALTTATTVTAGGLVNTGGDIFINGGGAVATLDITAAAPTIWTGQVNLIGNGVLEFATGSIVTNSGGIELQGPGNFIADSGGLGSNGALTGLASNPGTLRLESAPAVVTSVGLSNAGGIDVDDFAGFGGSTLTIGGTLTNSGSIAIGNFTLSAATTVSAAGLLDKGGISLFGGTGSDTNEASLLITGAAPSVLSNTLDVEGHALLQFGGGSITTVMPGGFLTVGGPNAFIQDAGLSGNTALSGLTSISAGPNTAAIVELDDAALTTSVGLTVSGVFQAGGTLNIDTRSGVGGGMVTIGGALTPMTSGFVTIGNATMSAATTVSATALVMSGGLLDIGGGSGTDTNQATLVIGSAAPAVLSGTTNVDFHAAIIFNGGSINTIASGAELGLFSPNAFVEDAGQLGSNTALTGLTSVGGIFSMEDSVTLVTSGGLVNTGIVEIDINSNTGGSMLTIGGTLTNSAGSNGGLDIGNILQSAATTVSATALINTGGLGVDGGTGSDTNQTSLVIAGAAPAVLSGTVHVVGHAAIEFGSGSVNSVGSGTTVDLDTPNAFIEDAGQLGSNSALAGLSLNAGTVLLEDGAALTISGGFTNSGAVALDDQNSFFNSGGSHLTVLGGVSGMASGAQGIRLGSNSVVEFGSSVAAGQTVSFSKPNGTVALDDPTQFGGTISGMTVGSNLVPTNQIDLTTIANSTIGAVSLDTTTDQLSVVLNGGSSFAIQLSGSYAPTTVVDRIVDAGGNGTDLFLSTVTCFCRGTQILTVDGEVPVEELAVGDRIRTLSGGLKPIVWIGLGRSLVTRANKLARPVIVRRGALAENVPARDLYLTHGHALYIDSVLIPVENLVNHRSILWDESARVVEYYHIELEDHEVVLANGAPAETYYDASNRAQFHNTRPESAAGGARPTFAPVLTGGTAVDRAWLALFERAGGRIVTDATDDPDLHLEIEGVRLDPFAVDGFAYSFALTAPPAGTLRLRSHSGVPSLLGITAHDHRRLGVAISRLVINQPGIATILRHDAPLLVEGGCHPAESGHCWTDGDLALPVRLFAHLRGAFTLTIHTERPGGMRYPVPAVIGAAA